MSLAGISQRPGSQFVGAYSQDGRRLGIRTPLGDDVLLLGSFVGQEELSRLFQFQLELYSVHENLSPQKILGRNVTFWIVRPDGSPQYFNGCVQSFVSCGRSDRLSAYRATVVPWLWFLTKTTDCRIFQSKSVPAIVEQIFGDLGFRDFSTADVKQSHPKWDYCVQYRESDFHFVSRLLEQEGIYYYFVHENGRHMLVLADEKRAYRACQDGSVEMAGNRSAAHAHDQLTRWDHCYEFRTGRWAHTDYNFETPATNLLAATRSLVRVDGNDRFESYEYPGQYECRGDGDAEVRIRMEEEEAAFDVVRGAGSCMSFSPGAKFKLARHDLPSEQGRGYVLTAVRHAAGMGGSYVTEQNGQSFLYENEFTCIPDHILFRPARLTARPSIDGVQTAVVTGPPDEEIYTDQHGRVKVQFHWDREGQRDAETSCWLRVSQVHAGKGFGGIDIPRVGEEVIVSFIDGDPDRPIVTGRVYNADVKPPFALPDGKTRSGLKSNTYRGGGFNELSMDDTAGKEEIKINAQFDMNTVVGNNQTLQVGVDRSAVIRNIDTLVVGVDRKEQIGSTKCVEAGHDVLVKAAKNILLAAGTSITLKCGLSSIYMNQAGFIQIDGLLVNVSGAIRTSIDGLITNVSGMLLTNTGTLTISEGSVVNKVTGAKTTIDGAPVKINC